MSSPAQVSPVPLLAAAASADLYYRVRQKEGRIYPDEIVSRLPDFPVDHSLRQEWLARRHSAHRLVDYLRALDRPLRVLDVGCGNGWLSHLLTGIHGAQVWAFDRIGPELRQAARLFSAQSAQYLVTEISAPAFSPSTFDVIVLASVIQYFPDLPLLITELRGLLRSGGEIHLLDSPLYAAADVEAARRRTLGYYTELGFPEMAALYHHHTTASLDPFSPDYLYRPGGIRNRLSRQAGSSPSPFPWVRLR